MDSKEPQIESLAAAAKNLPNAEEAKQDVSAIKDQWKDLKNDFETRKANVQKLLDLGNLSYTYGHYAEFKGSSNRVLRPSIRRKIVRELSNLRSFIRW